MTLNCVVTGKNNEELENRTNEAFSNVVHYYESSGLKLNQNKPQIINFNNNQIKMKIGPKQDDFQESVKHARMLGIQIDKDLNFQKHIDNVISDINYRLLVFKKISMTANLKSRLVPGPLICSNLHDRNRPNNF